MTQLLELKEEAKDRRRTSAIITAAAVAVVLVAGGWFAASNLGASEQPVQPADTPAETVARDFVEAYGSGDADRAIGYLADGADTGGLIASQGGRGDPMSPEEVRTLMSLLEAQRYSQTVSSCVEESTSAAGVAVRCTVEFDALGSDELGLGPNPGGEFSVTVDDGHVSKVLHVWNAAEFGSESWEPFTTWVSENYPEDAAVMYRYGVSPLEDGSPRITEESIALWDQHVQEYVATSGGT
ncbi:MAG: hypothetical protein ABWZ26_06340 [Candidatus Nanopelagicales bacterium]